MLTTAHLLLGAAIGKAADDPVVAALLAFGSHYILDAIPHYAPKPLKRFRKDGLKDSRKLELFFKSIEPFLGLVLTAIMVFHFNPDKIVPMISGSFFGWVPDLLVFLDWKYKIPRPKAIAEFEDKYHAHVSFLKGLPTFFLVCAGCLVYLIIK